MNSKLRQMKLLAGKRSASLISNNCPWPSKLLSNKNWAMLAWLLPENTCVLERMVACSRILGGASFLLDNKHEKPCECFNERFARQIQTSKQSRAENPALFSESVYVSALDPRKFLLFLEREDESIASKSREVNVKWNGAFCGLR